MISVVIVDNHEPNVVELTYENLWRELKDIKDAELLVKDEWFDVSHTKNNLVCYVEADCLVNGGFFASQLGLLKKDPMSNKIACLGTATAVNDWGNRFFGYHFVESNWSKPVKGVSTKGGHHLEPIKEKRSSVIYATQVTHIPGAIMRKNKMQEVLTAINYTPSWTNDLVYMSTMISLGFWRAGLQSKTTGKIGGNSGAPVARVHINPNTTYVTTEDYVNDLGKFDVPKDDLLPVFKRESIG